MRHRLLVFSLATSAWVILAASMAWAQTGRSGIAGVVRDASGAVLPGVTVEATSPALIEKVRTVTTDGQGNYKIIELPPGVYAVTFTLPGFATVKREGVELPVSFTAPVNAEMRVGALEETITVTGQTPLVDVQNTVSRSVLSATLLDAVPTARAFTAYASMTPGVNIGATGTTVIQDVGGSKGDQHVVMSIHGSRTDDSKIYVDGFDVNFTGGSGRLFIPNTYDSQEVGLDLGNGGAEARLSGYAMNFIPKSGGNTFSGDVYGTYTNDHFQSNNFSSELAARGLDEATLNRILPVWDLNGAVGGPIKRDRLWFFASHRQWRGGTSIPGLFYNKTADAFPPQYTPDLSRPAVNDFKSHTSTARFTWQASTRHKFAVSHQWQDRCDCHRDITTLISPEGVAERIYSPVNFTAVTWSFPASNRLLFEGGFQYGLQVLDVRPQAEAPNGISVLETTTGFSFGGRLAGVYEYHRKHKGQPRVSVSYVTGSHAITAGFQAIYVWGPTENYVPNNLKYTLRNGVPTSLQQFAMPHFTRAYITPDSGFYARDQWTIKRLTLNLGVRIDYLRQSIPAYTLPAVQFRPQAVDLPAVSCTACLTDVGPRLSAAYDLFGTGKTALKVSVGRYSSGGSAVTNNPAGNMVTSASRSWNDADRDFVPDCNLNLLTANGECGQVNNLRFGTAVPGTKLADDVAKGLRQYNWQVSAAIQHELISGVSVNVGYFRTSWYNFLATDNQRVTAADYDPYCLTLPPDPRLPGGGGNQLCGLYDISPTKFGQVDNVVTLASHYGEQTEIYNGFDTTILARFPNGATLSGGASTGRTATDSCFVVDSPQALLFCNVVPPFQTQFKLNGVYPLPWDWQVSGNFQSLAGIPIGASFQATNALIAPSLGRNLSGTSSTVNIPNIIAPQQQFEGRINQLDLRLTRNFRIGRTTLRGNFDVYNALNAAPLLGNNVTFGPRWLNATSVLDARLFKLSGQLSF